MRRTGAAALLGLALGADAWYPTNYAHCADEPGCPAGKPGCMPTGAGRPMLARVEMNKQKPHDTQKRYFYLGRGRQTRLSCLHVEHDLGQVHARIVYSSPPTAAQTAACEDSANTQCHGHCVWSMETFKSGVQPKDCTRDVCKCRALGDTNGDGTIGNGNTNPLTDRDTTRTELVESRLFQFTADESSTAGHPGHYMWNNQGISWKDPVIYKAHGGMDADFYIQYWTDKQAARLTTPGQTWGLTNASISFTARVEDPTDYFCFTEADTKMPFSHRDPVGIKAEDSFLDSTPHKDDSETEIPRHAGFQYMIDRPRIIASASGKDSVNLGVNYRYWDLGRGPQIDMSCVNVWSTTTGVPHSSTEHCTNAQYGWDQMGWNNKVALMGNVSAAGANLTVDVLDVFDCNAYTMWTDDTEKYHHNPTAVTDPFYSRDMCCYQTNAQTCAGQQFAGVFGDERFGQPACFWNAQNEMCYPLDTLAIRSLKETVGSKETYTIQSGNVHLPQSSYVVQRGELMAGKTGNTMRRWFLRVGNHMRLNEPYPPTSASTSVNCPLSVLVSYKSNTHGGTCEPSGRNMCDTQAEMCTKKFGWAVRNSLQFWKAENPMIEMGEDIEGMKALDNNEKRYNGCNCLKEKEICYRNAGCTSTKKYQLILQNCYDQKCGDYCNSAGSARAVLLMVFAAVSAAIFA